MIAQNKLRIGVFALLLVAASSSLRADRLEVIGAGKYPAPPLKTTTLSKKQEAKKDEEKKKPYGDEKAFNDVVKEMQAVKGLFTFYRKLEDNRVYLEILPDQFERTFLFAGSIE